MWNFRSTGDLAHHAPEVYRNRCGDDRDGDPFRPELRTVDRLTCRGVGTDPANPAKWCPECGGIGLVPVDDDLIEIELTTDPHRPESPAWTDADREAFAREYGIIDIVTTTADAPL